MSLSDKQDVESPPDGFGCGYVGGNSYGCGWGTLDGDGRQTHNAIGYGHAYGFEQGSGYGAGHAGAAPQLLLRGYALSGPAFDDLIRHAALTSCI